MKSIKYITNPQVFSIVKQQIYTISLGIPLSGRAIRLYLGFAKDIAAIPNVNIAFCKFFSQKNIPTEKQESQIIINVNYA